MMRFEGQGWAPSVFTKPLSPSFPSDGYRLIELVEKYYRTEDGTLLKLDEWQKALLIHVLERYPDDWPIEALRGRLRYRQVVISMGRQNGKSVIAAILSLYGLLQHVKGPLVIGVASNREQADIIYGRTFFVIKNTQKLNQKIKATGTRGLRYRDGSGSYQIRASKGEALQGLPITLGLADELHIMRPEVWDSMVTGQKAQKDGLLVGITTAGDDNSELLKRLYKQGEDAALKDINERFGFFLWEAPEQSTLKTPGAIEAANPAVACGRIDLETVRSDEGNKPEPDQQRYTLNRFVASINSWLPMSSWYTCAKGGVPEGIKDLVFSVERTLAWEWATVQVTAKVDGKLYTETVCRISEPTLDRLTGICNALYGKYPGSTFAVDVNSLGSLGHALKDRGFEVYKLTAGEMGQAASNAYAKIVQQTMSYETFDVLDLQMPRAKRVNTRDGGWRLAKTEGALGVDSVMALIIGLYVSEVKPPKTMQLFV